MDKVNKQLNEAFPPESIKTLAKAGGFDYIPVSEVIARLNNVLGTENWSYIADCERDSVVPAWIVAHVALSVTANGTTSTKDGYGGSEFKESGRGMDLADTYKAAVSEALKKAAQAFGVGLHLARDEEMIAREMALTEPISEEYFLKLTEKIEEAPDSSLHTVMEFWDQIAPSESFVRENVTTARLNEILDYIKGLDAK